MKDSNVICHKCRQTFMVTGQQRLFVHNVDCPKCGTPTNVDDAVFRHKWLDVAKWLA